MFNFRKNKDYIADSGCVITQPSQAFTPRQILDQFARNEIVPSIYEPSDMLSDDNVSDEDMENIIEFEDKIDAEGHLKENQYSLLKPENNETDQSEPETPPRDKESSAEITD